MLDVAPETRAVTTPTPLHSTPISTMAPEHEANSSDSQTPLFKTIDLKTNSTTPASEIAPSKIPNLEIATPETPDSKISLPKTPEPKTSTTKVQDPKTSSLQARSDSPASTPTHNPVTQDATTALLAAPPQPSPIVPWSDEVSAVLSAVVPAAVPAEAAPQSTADIKVSSNQNPNQADATGAPIPTPKTFKDAVLSQPHDNSPRQDSSDPATAKPISAAATDTDTVPAPSLSKTPTTANSQTQPAPSPAHNASHPAEPTESPIHSAIKSEIEQVMVPLPIPTAPAAPIPTSGKLEFGTSRETQTKPSTDKSKLSDTPQSLGAVTKNIESTSGAKTQTAKDDSLGGNSQPADQIAQGAPAKTADSTPIFSVATLQASVTGEAKTAPASEPHANSSLADQLQHESTGAAQTPAGENPAAYPASLFHSAKLLERIGEAELRLGIRAGEFGSVDIRTSMVRNQFTAEISVERGELGRVMAAELPGLQNRLAEQRVPVANIVLQNHAGSHSAASEQQKPREGQVAYGTNPGIGREHSPLPAPHAWEGSAAESRLDIHI